jgi:hypothetical protein
MVKTPIAEAIELTAAIAIHAYISPVGSGDNCIYHVVTFFIKNTINTVHPDLLTWSILEIF